MTSPAIAVAPSGAEIFGPLIEQAGGRLVDVGQAEGLVWTDPGNAAGLKNLLTISPARWVQLPFAGIESFFAEGVIDADRTWTCAKGIYGRATAEHALALILMAARRLHLHARATAWASEAWLASGFGATERRLTGATVVIIGTGGIGSALVSMLKPIGPRVVGVNRSGRQLEGVAATVTSDRLIEVLSGADFVVVAAAHTRETHHLLDASALAALSPHAWLVNVARGGLVDTDALVDTLRRGAIGGAALDVTDPEPLPQGHPLWSFDNVVITPHVANTWDMAVPELAELVHRNVRRFALRKELEGLVDPAAGY